MSVVCFVEGKLLTENIVHSWIIHYCVPQNSHSEHQPSTPKKHVTSMSSKLEPAIWSCDTGQQIPNVLTGVNWPKHRCPISKKEVIDTLKAVSWSKLATILGNSAVTITMVQVHASHDRENQFMGFLLFPIWVWGFAGWLIVIKLLSPLTIQLYSLTYLAVHPTQF